MKTNILQKIFAKIATLGIVVSMLAPFIGTVHADAYHLSVGVNVSTGYLAVYMQPDTTTPITSGYGYDYSYNSSEGYYTVDRYNQDAGDYVVRFNPTSAGGYIVSKVFVNGVEHEPYIDPVSNMVTVYLDLSSNKTVYAFYDFPGPDAHMLNLGVNVSQGYMELYSATDMTTPITQNYGYNCSYDSTEGYYTCPRYDQDEGDYVVRFNPDTTDGYVLQSIYVNGVEVTPYDSGGKKAVFIDLNQDKTVFAYYDFPGPDAHLLNIGVNVSQGYMELYNASDMTTPIMGKHGYDCSYDSTEGYYTCPRYDQDADNYVVRFNSTTIDGFVLTDIFVNGASVTPYDSGGMDAVYIDLDGDKTVFAYYDYPSEDTYDLSVGVNQAEGGFTVTETATGIVVMEKDGSECSYDSTEGYYTCTAFELPITLYTVTFHDINGEAVYQTPGTVYVDLDQNKFIPGYYSTFPSGIIQVQIIDEFGVEINSLPTNHWNLQKCDNINPTSCTTVVMSGGPGAIQEELQYGDYRLFVDEAGLPGYGPADIYNTLNETPHTVLTEEDDFIVFTIEYSEESETFTDIEIRAKKDGTLSPVDFIYCIGDVALPSSLACEAVQSTTDTIQAIPEASTEQGIFIHREAGYQTPYNEDIGTSAVAQDVTVTGFEDYYYYPITGEELADERVTMAYNQVPPEAIINVAVTGPSAMVSAEISISGSVANHVEIDNGDNQDFDVNSSLDYVVTCHDETGFYTLTPTIAVNSLMVGETRSVECLYADDVAFVNLGTLTNEASPQPLPAQATLVVTDPTGIDNQTQTTTVVDTDGTNTYYRLSTTTDSPPNNVENRFILETDITGYTPNVDGYIQCLPAPGGFHAPDNVILINNLHILTGEEEFAGLCEYYEVPEEDQVDITIDTIGVEETAIYVDGVEVRATDDDSEITVTITTTEEHTITFEDKDPANFRTPDPIVIPADTLDSTMSPHYLGYYVELGYETIVEIDTINENGFVYMTLSLGGTQYMVGYATPTSTLTLVVDNRNYHEFSFQDKNTDIPPYFLRAVPTAGCSVVTNTPETLSTTVVGSDTIIVRFQEYYICDGTTTALPATVTLTGHYIAKTDAAFFRAKTTNTNVDINGDITFTLGEPNVDDVSHPGSNTWTNIFVSDVENDTDDQVAFESPITVVMTDDYIAVPENYALTDFAPSDILNELTSTYILDEGLVDVAIRLVSFDPLIQPAEGLEVVMDDGGIDETTEYTVLDGTDIEAQFANVDSSSNHIFECPTISGLNPPNTVYVPAGTMTDGAENVFYCLYASMSGGAEIQILTTAEDQINLEAPIVLDVEGTNYYLGYTDGSVATDEANIELFVEATQMNTIEYGDVAGYITPANEVISVTPGTSYLDFGTDPETNPNMFLGEYLRGGTISVYTMDEVTSAVDGVDDAVIMLTNLTEATPAVELVGVGGTGYIEDIQVDSDADYMIEFGTHPTDSEYATPLPIYFNLSNGDVRSYIGVYVKNDCQVDLTREDINTGDALSAEVMLSVGGGAEYSLGTGNPSGNYLVSFLIDETQPNDTYEFRFVPLPNPLDIVNPPTLGLPTDTMTCPVAQTIYYGVSEGADITITLIEDTPTEDPVTNTDVTRNGSEIQTSDTNGEVVFTAVPVGADIVFSFADHPTDPTGFITPEDLVIPADTLIAGAAYDFTVRYVPVDCAVVLNLSTVDEDNTSINVNGEINLQTNSGPVEFVGVGTVVVNVCMDNTVDVVWGPAADPSVYALPAINPQTVDFTGVSAGDTIDIVGLYRHTDYTPLDFTVEAQDQSANELNPTFTYGGIPGTAPHSFQVMYEDLDNYTITFDDLDGYSSPADVVVTDRVVAVPENVTVTVNGIDYVAGTELAEGDTVVITATYLTSVTITKTVVAETIANNNVRADYTILVTNNSTSDLDVTLHDTISDTGGTLFGNNGGTMTVVTQGGDNTVCYNPLNPIIPLPTCPDIIAGDETFSVGAGLAVMITYQLLSNNSGIPAGQNSTFTNTASATYTDGAEITVDADANTVVSGPSTGGGGGGGGTTGGGGGHVLINGDMELKVEKLVSLNGTNYVDASDTDNALGIPTNRDSRVYVKVRLTNVGKVSAVNIEYKQAFEEGNSAMTSGDPQNVEGADSYDEDTKIIGVDMIPVNGTHEFTYEIMVSERGANGEYASDEIELLGFESRLPASQDFMTYMGIGDKYPSYLIAGERQGNVSQDEFLRITVESDVDEANIGDTVSFLITAENISDEDLTGLMIAHDYDESALEILNVYGGRDNGREVSFSRAILRPGETITFQIQTRVGGGAPVGDFVRGLTRALVNQSDGIAPVRNSIYIIGGVAPVDPNMELAQTGTGMMLLLLLASLLSYFGYGFVTRQRYAMIKRAALRPL